MRIQMFGSSLLAVAALVGCGGDDGNKIKVPDAKVFKDAAVDAPHTCTTKATIGTLSLGTMTMGLQGSGASAGQWYSKDMMTNIVSFIVGGKLTMMSGLDDDNIDDILLFSIDVPNGGLLTGVPYAFQTDANAMDQSKEAIFYGDVDASSNMAAMVLWPQAASPASALTFSMVTANGSAGTAPNIVGTVNAVKFAEIDNQAGTVVAGGCTSMVGGFNFYLRQTMASPRLAPSDPNGTDVGPIGSVGNPVLVHNKLESFEWAKNQIMSELREERQQQ